MQEYKHGVYGEILPSGVTTAPKQAGTLPVYFGTAPIHQLLQSPKAGEAVLVASFAEACEKLGYSDDWRNYTLCEAMDAHFKNSVQPIGPIVLVNVLDPATHCEAVEKTVAITFVKGRAEIPDPALILSTLVLEGLEATDYKTQWALDGSGVVVTSTKAGLGEISATYKQVTPQVITGAEIVGALGALSTIFEKTKQIPSILAAPGWSCEPVVYEALCAAANQIDGHWHAYVAADLPANSTTGTPATVLAYKREQGLGNSRSDLGWPCGKKGQRVYHLSTLNVLTMQWVDAQNGGIPFESPSNKPLDITGLCLADGTPVQFGQEVANSLNAAGIQTAIYWGQWVLWGSQTSGFAHGETMNAEEQFGATVRMLQFLANDFQLRYGAIADKPMKRSRVDTILNDTQERLDRYTGEGGILYGAITFEATSNTNDDMVAGNFVFDVSATTTPPGKSITAKLRWTDKGFATLMGGEENA